MTSSEDSGSPAVPPTAGHNAHLGHNTRDAETAVPVYQSLPSKLLNRVPKTNRTALRTLSHAAQFGYGYHPQPAGLPSIAPLDGLEALRAAAQQQAARESQSEKRSTGRNWTTALPSHFEWAHADPLAPLRERDLLALADWFERDDMLEVEADVDRCLLVLWPAPCWEDDPSEFWQELELLQEFL
jgi:hypothetical protein